MLPNNPRMARGLPRNPRPSSRPTTPLREEIGDDHQPRLQSYSQVRSRSTPPRFRSRTPQSSHSSVPLDAYKKSYHSHKPDHSVSPSVSSLPLMESYRTPESRLYSEDGVTTSNNTDGLAIWSRVATVANTLTVSVSKAWAANIPTFAGEETPPGQESRLIRVMKAYYLEKARDPSDLPDWLFDGHETRHLTDKPLRHHGLRDAYDPTALTTIHIPRPDTPKRSADDLTPASKTKDRLRAMRDAKRSAQATDIVAMQHSTRNVILKRDEQPNGTATRRIGLPSRPRRV